MTPQRVLVVDDTAEVRAILESVLSEAGFAVRCVDNGAAGIAEVTGWSPQVVVLDVVLPDTTGVEMCRVIRSTSDTFVLMLTSRDDEVDKLVGLAAGADDYLTKPFSPREVVARVQTLLRRYRTAPAIQTPHDEDTAGTVYVHGSVELDLDSREVHNGDDLIALTRIEFDLLAALIRRPRMVFTRRQLIEQVWGDDWYGDEHVVDVHLSNARRKLGPDSILTVRGVGYRMGDVTAPVAG